MQRYFFNILDGKNLLDEDGIMLDGLAEARDLAVIASGEALKDAGPRFWRHPDWSMIVTDESGDTVCRVRVSAE